jgi:hypothetical protein
MADRAGEGEELGMENANDRCPFLVPVMADRLWVYPMPAYCRRPDAQLRVPAGETLDSVCFSHRHLRCPGYLATSAGIQGPDA